MTSRQRILRTLAHESTDYIPIYPKIAFSNVIAAKHVTVKDFMSDPAKMAEATMAAQKLFGWDAVALHTDIGSEGKALGSVYEQPVNEPSHIVKYLLDDIGEYEKIAVPDPHFTEPMKTVIEAVKTVKQQIGKDVYVQAWTNGPLNVASQVLKLDDLLIAIYDDPDTLHLLLERCLETAVVYAKALVDAGADAVAFGHAMASTSVISRKQYEEFAFPYEKELISAIHQAGAAAITHICGNIEPIIDLICQNGSDIIDFDHVCRLDALREKAPGAVFRGNIDPALLALGTRDEVRDVVKTLIERDGRSGRLILGTGCEVALNTPTENLHAFVQAGREFGRNS